MHNKIQLLEHLTLGVSESCKEDSSPALFLIHGLGATRDPRDTEKIHVNFGLNQIHLLPDRPQSHRLDGHIGLMFSCLSELEERLREVSPALNGSCFSFERKIIKRNTNNDVEDPTDTQLNKHQYHLIVTCPLGNTYKCFQSPPRFDQIMKCIGTPHPGKKSSGLALPYLEIHCTPGTAKGIARFYNQYFDCGCHVKTIKNALDVCFVPCGPFQYLIFRKTNEKLMPYDGYHVCVYISNFHQTFLQFDQDGLVWVNPDFSHIESCLIWEETQKKRQFRIVNIVDPLTNETVLNLEHEIRASEHWNNPMKAGNGFI